jgi:hypothetical protein
MAKVEGGADSPPTLCQPVISDAAMIFAGSYADGKPW